MSCRSSASVDKNGERGDIRADAGNGPDSACPLFAKTPARRRRRPQAAGAPWLHDFNDRFNRRDDPDAGLHVDASTAPSKAHKVFLAR
jgi:hypothetical protein